MFIPGGTPNLPGQGNAKTGRTMNSSVHKTSPESKPSLTSQLHPNGGPPVVALLGDGRNAALHGPVVSDSLGNAWEMEILKGRTKDS